MRKVLIGIAAVIVLLLVAVLVVPFLIPFDKYKPELIAQVKQATGRDLRIDGAVRLSVIPRLELEVAKVGFSNAPGGQAKEMASLDTLKLALKLMPLLSGEIAVDSFVLDKPVIALEIDKQGKPNWVFADAPAVKEAKDKPKADKAKGSGLTEVRLDDIRIVGGSFSYLDQRSGAKEQASDVNLKVALPSLDQPLKADGDLVWKAKKIAINLGAEKPRALIEGGASAVGLQVKSEPINFSYKGQVTNATPAKVSGDIDLDVPSIRNLAAWTGNPIQAPGEKTLGPLSIKGKLAMDGAKIAFNEAKIAVDAIKAAGGVSVDTGGKKPAIVGKLEVERLDLNPYLPPEQGKPAAGGGSAAKSAPASSGWSDDPIDLAGLQAADADLNLSVGGIQVREIKIGKGVVVAKLKDGRLALDLTQLDLYKGTGTGKVVLDGTRSGSAGLDLGFNLAGVQAEPLLKDAAQFERLSGAGAFDLAVAGRGKSQRELIGALNGKGKIDFRDGAIKGINLAAMVRNIGNAFTGAGAASEKTDFSELGGTFTITNGILKNTDLALKSPLLRVEGAGTVDLPKRTVDYKVTPKAVASLQGQGGGDAAGISVPVLVQGPWDNLSYKPDLAGAIRNLGDPSKLLEGAKDLKNLPGQLIPGLPGQAPAGATQQQQQPTAPSPGGVLKGLFGR
jgi:AsmA protein